MHRRSPSHLPWRSKGANVRKALVQCGFGQAQELLSLSGPVHARYALDFGYDFAPCGERLCPDRDPCYEKLFWLADILEASQDGDFLAYLDCDALIVRPVDLITALGSNGFDIALSKWGAHRHYNTGVIFLRASGRVREFMLACKEEKPRLGLSNQMVHDEWIVNEKLPGSGLCVKGLDARWNDPDIRSETVIAGWHGMAHETKKSLMGRKAQELEAVAHG
jgi:hypothetical protein